MPKQAPQRSGALSEYDPQLLPWALYTENPSASAAYRQLHESHSLPSESSPRRIIAKRGSSIAGCRPLLAVHHRLCLHHPRLSFGTSLFASCELRVVSATFDTSLVTPAVMFHRLPGGPPS
jgi:hypothetical protein